MPGNNIERSSDLKTAVKLTIRAFGFLPEPTSIECEGIGDGVQGARMRIDGGQAPLHAAVVALPAPAQAIPMTYRIGKRQFIVICAGGRAPATGASGDSVTAFALAEIL